MKPDAPTPPNPIETARASTSTNVATGVANAFLNNVNQVTPQGALNYSPTGNYNWADPVTGTNYNIPTFTATQSVTPSQRDIQENTQATQYNMSQAGRNQSYRMMDYLSGGLDTAGAPARGDAGAITGVPQAATSFAPGGSIQSGLGDVGQQQGQFGAAGDITQTYGPADNYSADRSRVEESLMARMNPQLALERSGIEQRLADQGIRYGSPAYAAAMDDYNRQATDARFAAIGQGGAEQQRMNQMAAQLAAFQNAAQQQGYTQALGRGQFGNEAQQAAYLQQLGRGTFANQAQAQQFQQNAAQGAFQNAGLAQQLAQAQSGFNASNAARNQYMQEQYAQRNQPINEITSLLSGSQISQPNWINTPGSQIATTDVGGLINQNFNQQMQGYQQQNQNYQQLMGGILGLGAGALKLSDERQKENIDRIGTVFATNVDDAPQASALNDGGKSELPIYQYSYKADPAAIRHVGPMAQDVEKVDKRAVKTIGGIKHIDTRRVMGGILRAA